MAATCVLALILAGGVTARAETEVFIFLKRVHRRTNFRSVRVALASSPRKGGQFQ
jgi:hypothetical protein